MNRLSRGRQRSDWGDQRSGEVKDQERSKIRGDQRSEKIKDQLRDTVLGHTLRDAACSAHWTLRVVEGGGRGK